MAAISLIKLSAEALVDAFARATKNRENRGFLLRLAAFSSPALLPAALEWRFLFLFLALPGLIFGVMVLEELPWKSRDDHGLLGPHSSLTRDGTMVAIGVLACFLVLSIRIWLRASPLSPTNW